VDGVWDKVFELTWEAYSAGTIPVGALVADQSGAVVSRGRNRIFDAPAEPELGQSRLAHAELNALLPLPSERTYEGFSLYTALEPCHLCLAAATTTRIGVVRYAALDRYGGAVGKLEPSQDHIDHPLTIEGPLEGVGGRIGELLLIAHFLWRVPNGRVVRFYTANHPELVVQARVLPPPGAEATLQDAFAAIG
jgi:tRNA(adenine34) deaminase